MRRRLLLLLPVAGVLAALAFWAVAQPAPQPLSSLFPAGAVLYLEAKDFGALLADWNASAEKPAWLKSANHEVFSRSQLFLKLGAAQSEFASAAGVPPDYALLTSVAGANSGIAMYNIGKLEFLYVTRLASARALDTALWKARGSYQTRNAGGVNYYMKEDKTSHRVAAFSYAGDLLVLATTEDLMARALQLIARQPQSSVASEKWFSDAVRAADPNPADLRLVYNMDTLGRTFQFRSHWIQRNAPALREFSSGLADLERARGEIRERRVLLRTTPTPAAEGTVGLLMTQVPADAGFYQIWSHPSADQAEQWIEEKLFAGAVAAGPKSKLAPRVADTSDTGTEQDLETRIDEVPLSDDRNARVFAQLRERISGAALEAMLVVASTKADTDQVFEHPQRAMVLLARDAWNADAVRTALTSSAEGAWSTAGLGASWRAGTGGVQVLDGLGRIAIAIDGRKLILGDTSEFVSVILANRLTPSATAAVYAAGWRHSRELPNFERMMKLIDFPQAHLVPAEGVARGAEPEPAEPMFFSENVASLGQMLKRLHSATITVEDRGAMLRESVYYRLTP